MIAVLCGFMGAGKSTIGKYIARMSGCSYADLDKEVEKTSGCTITELFALHGEKKFRQIEHKTLKNLFNSINSEDNRIHYVLSLGGGTLTNPLSAELIRNNTHCIYLKCSNIVLEKRLIKNNAKRPLVASKTPEGIKEFVKTNVEKREPSYLSCSKIVIDCDNKSIADICFEIMNSLTIE